MSPTAIEHLVNGIEIVVWIAIGGIVAWRAWAMPRRDYWLPAIAFVAFGISDAVEISTGAWWKPWWLLVWKVACICIIGRFFWRALREHRKQQQPPSKSEDHDDSSFDPP